MRPHNHIVQIGDPILRKSAKEVPKDMLNHPLVKETIKELKNVIDKYDAIGLSAPQIGIDLKITCVQMTKKQINSWDEETIKTRQMEPIKKRILINPSYKVTNEDLIIDREGCCSMHGFSAVVPRHKEITVKFLSEDGEIIVWRAKNWTARILQHEIEHLDGKLFIDKMATDTLMFNYWKSVNNRSGNFQISFGGMKPVYKFASFFVPKGIIKQEI